MLCFGSFFMYANVKPTITGKVLEEGTNTPLEYATVSFTEIGERNPKYGGITNEMGSFRLK